MDTSILDESPAEMREQIQRLKAVRLQLAESMERAANDLRSTGLPPSVELISALQQYRQQLLDLRTQLDCEPGPSNGSLGEPSHMSLDDLERAFENQLTMRRAIKFLDRLEGLSHLEGDEHPVLATCNQARQQALDNVRGMNSNARATIQSIDAGQHPLYALWNLLDHPDQLNDDEWTEQLLCVAEQLGREVATAVARNRLFIRTGETSPESQLLVSLHA